MALTRISFLACTPIRAQFDYALNLFLPRLMCGTRLEFVSHGYQQRHTRPLKSGDINVASYCQTAPFSRSQIMSTRSALVFLLVIACATTAFAIKCWVCRSDIDKDCGDPFNNATLPITDCARVQRSADTDPASDNFCRKARVETANGVTIVRTCAKKSEHNIPGLEYAIECDDSDGCNQSPRTGDAF